MDTYRKRYRIYFFISLLILISCLTFILISDIDKANERHSDNAKELVLSVKSKTLKDIVNHIEKRIDYIHTEVVYDNDKLINTTLEEITNYYKIYGINPKDYIKRKFENKDYSHINAIVLDKNNNIIFENLQNHIDESLIIKKKEIIQDISYLYKQYKIGNYQIILSVDKSYIKRSVKELISKEIYNTKYSDHQYVWVNEIINYNGGAKYAKRLIHPNLPETEGTYLSTYTEDIDGNKPYLTELNGIKKNKELFFKYNLKEFKSEKTSEKLAYAKLYTKYNWVVASGVSLNDLNEYIISTEKQVQKDIFIVLVYSIISVIIIFALSLFLFSSLERKYYFNLNSNLESKFSLDSLTGAYSRKTGDEYLEKLFKEFKINDESPTILIFDIDNFKNINDTYGHNTGDIVLKRFVEIIKTTIRQNDKLFRWGGEEFILVCDGLNPEIYGIVANKIMDSLKLEKFNCNDSIFKITTSIGASVFNKDDKDYKDAIIRADEALYKSKSLGKDQHNFI